MRLFNDFPHVFIDFNNDFDQYATAPHHQEAVSASRTCRCTCTRNGDRTPQRHVVSALDLTIISLLRALYLTIMILGLIAIGLAYKSPNPHSLVDAKPHGNAMVPRMLALIGMTGSSTRPNPHSLVDAEPHMNAILPQHMRSREWNGAVAPLVQRLKDESVNPNRKFPPPIARGSSGGRGTVPSRLPG